MARLATTVKVVRMGVTTAILTPLLVTHARLDIISTLAASATNVQAIVWNVRLLTSVRNASLATILQLIAMGIKPANSFGGSGS